MNWSALSICYAHLTRSRNKCAGFAPLMNSRSLAEGRTMQTDGPSAGGVRAARAILLQRGNAWDKTAGPRLSEIIDCKTGAKELREELEMLLPSFKMLLSSYPPAVVTTSEIEAERAKRFSALMFKD